MSSALNVVDIDLALERAGGNHDLARELFQMLQNELPDYEKRISHYFNADELRSLLSVVHKLNGAATYCGVPALKSAASQLEASLKQQNEAAYAEGVETLLKEIQRLQQTPALDI